MDHVSKRVRSKIMASVRSRGNKTTEVAFARLLSEAGIRGYRTQWPVAGKPDFAWPRIKLAVFVDGCFWHGCTRCKYPPRTNKKFWTEKFASNKRRDRRVAQRLRRDGWRVIRIRECEIGSPRSIGRVKRMIAGRHLRTRDRRQSGTARRKGSSGSSWT
jgi:DNA mismatch endonuclease (patch repair protein)